KSDMKYDRKSYRSQKLKQGCFRKHKHNRELRKTATPRNHTKSGGHEIRTRNPLRGTTFPVWPLAIRLPSRRISKSYTPLTFRRHASIIFLRVSKTTPKTTPDTRF